MLMVGNDVEGMEWLLKCHGVGGSGKWCNV